jgi:DNA-binding CsgD family transcriptional regulator
MLRKLVGTTCDLADAMGGSVSLVDVSAGQYTKIAEMGTACHLGQRFPLNEGVTGQVMNRRAPVVLGAYREIPGGHLAAGHPAMDGAVVAIPIWWRSEIVAVNVIFAGSPRRYSAAEIDFLEMVTQVAAPGLVTAVNREMPQPTVSQRAPMSDDDPTRTGILTSGFSVGDVISGLMDLTQRASLGLNVPVGNLELRVVKDEQSPRLLVRTDAPTDPSADDGNDWQELVDRGAGVVGLHRVAAELDTVGSLPAGDGMADGVESNSPLTSREQEVVSLLSQGMTDRGIAAVLCLSPKTVEKHVGAIRRKTGTNSRTAAVVQCLASGWV